MMAPMTDSLIAPLVSSTIQLIVSSLITTMSENNHESDFLQFLALPLIIIILLKESEAQEEDITTWII